jgi:hypothetical protein
MTYIKHLIQRIDTALLEDALEEKLSRGTLAKIAAAGIGAAILGGSMANAQDVRRAQPVAPRAEQVQPAQPASSDDAVIQWMTDEYGWTPGRASKEFARNPAMWRQKYRQAQSQNQYWTKDAAQQRQQVQQAQQDAAAKEHQQREAQRQKELAAQRANELNTRRDVGAGGDFEEALKQAQEREQIVQWMSFVKGVRQASQRYEENPDYWKQQYQQRQEMTMDQFMQHMRQQGEESARRFKAEAQQTQQATAKAQREGTVPTKDQLEQIVRQTIAVRDGEAVANWIPLNIYGNSFGVTGRTVESEPEWSAIFLSTDERTVDTHGNIVTSPN